MPLLIAACSAASRQSPGTPQTRLVSCMLPEMLFHHRRHVRLDAMTQKLEEWAYTRSACVQSGHDSDAKALVGLLAPNGQLLRAIHTADLDTLIKFEFPLTRLPTHTQQLIRIEAGR